MHVRRCDGMGPIRVGMLLGAGGVALFGIYHWFFVAPVAAVFVEGLVWAAGGGALVGWAYQRGFLDQGRQGPLWGLAFGAMFASTLVPSEAVGLVWGPFDVTDPGDIPKALPLALLGVPLAIAIAWFLRPGRGLCWPFVAAVAVVHFMVGGSIANFGGRGGTALMFGGFVVFEVLAGWVMGVASGPSRTDGAVPVAA